MGSEKKCDPPSPPLLERVFGLISPLYSSGPLIPSSVNFSMDTGRTRGVGDARHLWLNKSHTIRPSPPT